MVMSSSPLWTCTSIAAFESTSLSQWQQNVKSSVQQQLLALKSDVEAEQQLFKAIPWKELCKAYNNNDSKKKISRHNKHWKISAAACHDSPLQALCSLLINPTVLPYAYTVPLILCLTKVMFLLLPHGSSSALSPTPSDKLLLDHIMNLHSTRRIPAFQLRPPLERLLTQHLAMIIKTTTHQAQSTTSSSTTTRVEEEGFNCNNNAINIVHQLEKFLSILSTWSSSACNFLDNKNETWFGATCMSLMLSTVEYLDDYDIQLLKLNKTCTAAAAARHYGDNDDDEERRNMCLNCHLPIRPLWSYKKRKRSPNVLLTWMDQVAEDDEQQVPAYLQQRSFQQQHQCRCLYSEQADRKSVV